MEIIRAFEEVLSSEEIADLHRRCDFDLDNSDLFFDASSFINGLSLINYGESDPEWGTAYSNIIDTKGNFIDIQLDKNIKYLKFRI